uniref:Uncharacterized protein n=1 Tax=Sipha flava TaxID=143950 RepID=A0A2S2Q5S4_9HEMI
MLSRNPAPGPPVDEDQLEERLVGVPTSPPTNTTNPPADNIFTTVETVDVLSDVPFSTTILASWQSNDPQTRDIIKRIKSDTPARNTRSATKDTDTFVLLDGLLRQNVKGHLSIVIPKIQSQQVIGGITTTSLLVSQGGRKLTGQSGTVSIGRGSKTT